MEFPSVTSVTDALKSILTSNEPAETTGSEPVVEAAPDEKNDDTSEPSQPDATQDEQKQTPAPVTPSDPASVVVGIVKEKGIGALLEILPADVREELRKAEYPKLHQTLSESRKEAALARKEGAAEIAALERKFDERIDELLTAGMSDEEKQARKDAKDLAELRKEKAEPKPRGPVSAQEVSQAIAATPFAPAFWETVSEIGLPKDPANPQVRAFYEASLKATNRAATVEDAIDLMRTLAPNFKAKADPTPADDIEKRVTEMVEKRLEDIKKRGLLSADTGKPGASGGTKRSGNSWDDAHAGLVEGLERARGR